MKSEMKIEVEWNQSWSGIKWKAKWNEMKGEVEWNERWSGMCPCVTEGYIIKLREAALMSPSAWDPHIMQHLHDTHIHVHTHAYTCTLTYR